MTIDVEKLRTMELHGEKLTKEEQTFVLQQFFKFYKMTKESCFESFKEWITWDEEKRNKEILPAVEVFKLVTEKGIPKDRIEDMLESKGVVMSWNGFEVHMDRHRIASGGGKPRSVF